MKEGDACIIHPATRCALLNGRAVGPVRVWSWWDKLRLYLFG